MSRLHTLHRLASTLLRDDCGQDLVEYGLLAALISTIVLVALTQVGSVVNAFWAAIAANIP